MPASSRQSLLLKQLRVSLDLTQTDFAAKIGVSQGTITDIERGRIGISRKVSNRITEKLGINAGEYFGNNSVNNNEKMQGGDAGVMQADAKNRLTELLTQLKKDPDWEKAFTIHNQILISNNKELEPLKKLLGVFWEHQRKIFQFVHQYSIFFSANLQDEIFRSLKNGNSEDQILDQYQAIIRKIKPVVDILNQLNKELKNTELQLKPFDIQNLMDLDIKELLVKQEFEKTAPLHKMHTIPTSL